jgi:hypothetical protein
MSNTRFSNRAQLIRIEAPGVARRRTVLLHEG